MRSAKRRNADNDQQTSNPVHSGTAPALEWVDEVETKFRFRYESELGKGSHGGLRSCSSTASKKHFPKLRLLNYNGMANVRVRLVTEDDQDHVHKLVSCKDSKPVDHMWFKMPDTSPRTVELKNLGILFIGKEKLDHFCREVISDREDCDQSTVKAEVMKYRKKIENIVVLCIDAYDENNMAICETIVSKPIRHSKSPATSDINIEHISRVSGLSKGGEDVLIFCSRVQKGNIEVRFFERDDKTGKRIWEAVAPIHYIHHQVGIYFRTPPYNRMQLKEKVEVQFELYRKTDDERSNARDFTYIPDDSVELQRKKRRTAGSFNPQPLNPPPLRPDENISPPVIARPPAASTSIPCPSNLSSIPSEEAIGIVSTLPMAASNIDTLMEEEGEASGLRTESSDPCLSGDALLYEDLDLLQHFSYDQPTFMVSRGNLDDSFDRAESGQPMMDSINSITLVLTEEERLRQAHYLPNPIVSEDPTVDTGPRRAVLQPDAGKGLAFRLALTTARSLHDYSRTGDVRYLLASMRHLIAVQDEAGDNPIHSAVINSLEDTLRDLVEVARTVPDYDILNMCNDIKQTPLHIAVITKQAKLTEVLLYHGCDPNAIDNDGNTPVHLAARHNSTQCLEELLNTNKYTAKYQSHVPDMDAYNFAGFTALHVAVLSGSESIVRILCANGAEVDLLDRTNGRSALHLAVDKHHISMIRLLLEEAGADTDVHMFNGNTPLHLACDKNELESISLLVQAHADPYLENLEIAGENISDAESWRSEEEDDSDETGEASAAAEVEQKKKAAAAATTKDEPPENLVEVRGLTCLDLARSDEVRRILRGEGDPIIVQAKPKVPQVQELVAAKAAGDKPEKKPDLFDSGIGFSGTNISLTADSLEDDTSKIPIDRVTERLDELTLRRLAARLDADDKWKKVAILLGLDYLINTLQHLSTGSSPSIDIMSYAQVDRFEEALEKLKLTEELKLFKEAKASPPIAKMTALVKQVQELNL